VNGETAAADGSRAEHDYPARSRYKGPVAKGYVERRSAGAKWRREQEIISECLRRLPRGSTILDVPIGTGRFIEFYKGCDHHVYGLDVSSDMVAEAHAHAERYEARLTATLGEAESIPLRDRSIDYVLCVRLLNWVPLPVLANMLSEFGRVSRKGVLIHVRSRIPLGPAGLLRALVHDALWRAIPALRGLPRKLGRRATRRTESSSTPQTAQSPNDMGYVLHDDAELRQVIESAGFEVREKIPIHSLTTYSRSYARSLHLYVLQRAEQDV